VLVDKGVATRTPQLAAQWKRYAEHYRHSIDSCGEPIVVPGGERAKDDPFLQQRLSSYIEEHGIDRHSFVIAIGTLNSVDRRAGMAEAVKVALIRDAAFFNWIEANTQSLARFDKPAVNQLIERCAQLHLQQITQAGDPFETGTARPLDFGHWAAHRLEKMTRHEVSHGDAVAIGIALDSRYAQLSGRLDANSLERIINVLEALQFPLDHPAMFELDEQNGRALFTGLDDFQRHLGGQLSITLLTGIGESCEVHDIDRHILEHALTLTQTQVQTQTQTDLSHPARILAIARTFTPVNSGVSCSLCCNAMCHRLNNG